MLIEMIKFLGDEREPVILRVLFLLLICMGIFVSSLLIIVVLVASHGWALLPMGLFIIIFVVLRKIGNFLHDKD